jgi:hypothetical protein
MKHIIIGLMALMLVGAASALVNFQDDFNSIIDGTYYAPTMGDWNVQSFLYGVNMDSGVLTSQQPGYDMGGIIYRDVSSIDFNNDFHIQAIVKASNQPVTNIGFIFEKETFAQWATGIQAVTLETDYVVMQGYGGCSGNSGAVTIPGFIYDAWYLLDVYKEGNNWSIFLNNTYITSAIITCSDYSTLNYFHVMPRSRYSFVDYVSLEETLPCTPDWSCNGYAACLINDTQVCNSVTDLNTCGESYGGDYSEFTPQACDFCTPDWSCNGYAACLPNSTKFCNSVLDLEACGEAYGATTASFLRKPVFL